MREMTWRFALQLPLPTLFLITHVNNTHTSTLTELVTRNALRQMPDYWLEQCINFDAMFSANLMPYTVQPNVMMGRIDLAAVFLQRESLVAESVKFGEYALCLHVSLSVVTIFDIFLIIMNQIATGST